MRSALLPVILLAAAGCAVDTPAADEANLIGGSTTGEVHSAVGALYDTSGDGAEGSRVFCTATLIHPRFVVTAQHCIEAGGDEDAHDRDATTVELRLGGNANAPSSGVKLKRWIRPEPFDYEGVSFYSDDIMLGELAAPITDVRPIPLTRSALTEADLGARLEVVGFGVDAEDGLGAPSGLRKAGTFKLEALRGNAFEKRFGSLEAYAAEYRRLDPAGFDEGVHERSFAQGALHEGYEAMAYSETAETCYSDSGGPLIRVTGDKREVVGVVSRGFPGLASSCMHLGTVFALPGPRTLPGFTSAVR